MRALNNYLTLVLRDILGSTLLCIRLIAGEGVLNDRNKRRKVEVELFNVSSSTQMLVLAYMLLLHGGSQSSHVQASEAVILGVDVMM